MIKKYQVFVSSTYEDLRKERKKVIKCLLQMNCFPVGMEHFSASDSSQWEVIKKLIQECDYYILILGGRYGSIDEKTGKSFTQKEFEYAQEQKIPVLSFLYEHPENLPVTSTETDPLRKEVLNKFEALVKGKLCNFWNNPDELASKIATSLSNEIRNNPRSGWTKIEKFSLEKHILLDRKFNFTEIHDQITQSKETYIFGLGCTISTKMLFDECIKQKEINYHLKFLYMSSEGNAVKLAAKREGNSLKEVKKRYNDNFSLLDQMQKKFPDHIQYNAIDYLPPYNLFIFNPQEEKGEILVHLAGWKASSTNERPLFKLSKQNNKEWFSYFINEFNTLWDSSQPIL